MAKRTVDTKFADADLSRSVERRFLSSNQDSKELCYEYDPPQEASLNADTDITAGHVSDAGVTATPSKAELPAPAALPVAAALVADIPMTAKNVIQCLVAQKLRKEFEKVSEDRSIKELCGGKSTLQNELLGDFGKEFGTLPDAPEDLPLASLAEAVDSKFSGKMGKQTTAIVGKVISAKMPAGFTQSAIRKYLEQTWGLGESRQTAVLVYSITAEPLARLSSTEDARKYYDTMASQYAETSGITLGLKASDSSALPQTAAVVDSSHLDSVRAEQREMALKQFKVLANYLKIDPSNDSKLLELETLQQDSQESLDLWNAEFAADFQSGIKPCFDVMKARRFGSPWNLVRQDILCLYYCAEQDRMHFPNINIDVECLHIANRSDDSVRRLLTNLTKLSQKHQSQGRDEGFALVGQKLLSVVDSAVDQQPTYRFMRSTTAPKTTLSPAGKIEYREIPRSSYGREVQYLELLRQGKLDPVSGNKVPHVHLKRLQSSTWKIDPQMTETFLECLDAGTREGLTFSGKNVLLTGAGQGSIGAQVLRGFLMGGGMCSVPCFICSLLKTS